jgi:hypothetical protein
MESSDANRRKSERVEAFVVVQLDKDGRHGVTRDVSDKGFLIATRSRFAPGDRLDLTVYAKSGTLEVTARVVRVDESPPGEEWSFRIAVELDGTLPQDVIDNGAAAAATLIGGSK